MSDLYVNAIGLPRQARDKHMESTQKQTVVFFLQNVGVTQAVNDMLLTSHGYGLRLFPLWAALRPRESASFRTLRAKGAFLVSADYDGALQRVVGNVTIVSEVPAPGNIYATPLRFKLGGHPVPSARFNVETAGSEPKRPEI
jgi:hypothetical protein